MPREAWPRGGGERRWVGPIQAFLSWTGWTELCLKLPCLIEIATVQGRFESAFPLFRILVDLPRGFQIFRNGCHGKSNAKKRENNVLIRNVNVISDWFAAAPQHTHERARTSVHTGHNFVF